MVAGLGGTGCSVALNLALAGVGHLPPRQTRRRLPGEPSPAGPLLLRRLGRSKAEVAASFLSSRTGAEVAFRALNMDDSNASRCWPGRRGNRLPGQLRGRCAVNRACVAARIPLVHIGLPGVGGSVGGLQEPRDGLPGMPCSERRRRLFPPATGVGSLGAATSAIGSVGALQAIRLLPGASGLLGQDDHFGLSSARLEISRDREAEDCQSCGA